MTRDILATIDTAINDWQTSVEWDAKGDAMRWLPDEDEAEAAAPAPDADRVTHNDVWFAGYSPDGVPIGLVGMAGLDMGFPAGFEVDSEAWQQFVVASERARLAVMGYAFQVDRSLRWVASALDDGFNWRRRGLMQLIPTEPLAWTPSPLAGLNYCYHYYDEVAHNSPYGDLPHPDLSSVDWDALHRIGRDLSRPPAPEPEPVRPTVRSEALYDVAAASWVDNGLHNTRRRRPSTYLPRLDPGQLQQFVDSRARNRKPPGAQPHGDRRRR